MELKENIWQCLNKPIPIEFDSSKDSDNFTSSSDSTGSPPRKRLRFRRLREFKTAEELEELKSVAAEVVELKDYAEWFMSRSETNVDILHPKYYCEWVSTLGTEAKANVIVAPYNYCTWYYYFVIEGTGLPREDETETTAQRIKRYGEVALTHFNKTSNCSEDYEYSRGCEIVDVKEFVHLNFYARLKVSESGQEPGPGQLFFAEVSTQNEVIRCCILDSKEFGNSAIRHPPGFECLDCMDDDYVCYFGPFGCAFDDE